MDSIRWTTEASRPMEAILSCHPTISVGWIYRLSWSMWFYLTQVAQSSSMESNDIACGSTERTTARQFELLKLPQELKASGYFEKRAARSQRDKRLIAPMSLLKYD